ncbi:MAG: ABC transporter permease [Bacteroidota bacterium]|nr:ABC transporter permease [Bacteroidota bacterium]
MEYTKYKSAFVRVLMREFSRITGRTSIYLLSIFLPLLLFIFIALIYQAELVRKLPVAVYDADNSYVSRLITNYIESTSTMQIYKHVNSVEEIKEEFRKGTIQGAFVLPKNMEATIKSGGKTAVTIYQNGTNLIVSNYLLNDGTKIVKMISAGTLLKKLQLKSLMPEQAMAIANPIRLDTQVLYNPNYSYESFLAPGVIIALFQMIIMAVAALIFSSEFEHETFKELVGTANGKIWPIILGKSLPHLLIHICTLLFFTGCIFSIFNIRHVGSVFTFILLLIFFAFVTLMLGLAISIVLKNQQTATEAAMFINTPAFIFSGFTFPLWSMPYAHNLFAQIIPFTHLLNAYMKFFLMGGSVQYILPEIRTLFIFLVISVSVIVFCLYKAIKKISYDEVA